MRDNSIQLRIAYFTFTCTRGAEGDQLGADEDEFHQKRAFPTKSVTLKAHFQINDVTELIILAHLCG